MISLSRSKTLGLCKPQGPLTAGQRVSSTNTWVSPTLKAQVATHRWIDVRILTPERRESTEESLDDKGELNRGKVGLHGVVNACKCM